MGVHKTSERSWNRRKSQTFKVENETELQEVLTKISIDKDQLTFVEVVMSQGDQPELLVKLGKRFGQQNKKKSVTYI